MAPEVLRIGENALLSLDVINRKRLGKENQNKKKPRVAPRNKSHDVVDAVVGIDLESSNIDGANSINKLPFSAVKHIGAQSNNIASKELSDLKSEVMCLTSAIKLLSDEIEGLRRVLQCFNK